MPSKPKPEIVAAITERIRSGQASSVREACRQIGWPENRLGEVKRWLAAEKISIRAIKQPEVFNVRVAPADPLEVQGDVMVIGDVHVPTTNYAIASQMLAVARRYLKAPRQLIVAGDLFNLDFLSIYPPSTRETAWEQEKEAARHMIAEWLRVFHRIYFIAGNHERRYSKASGGQFKIIDLMDMVTQDKRVTVSEWGHLILTSGDRDFRVTHGRNYSVNTGTVGNELAHKYEMNIISHHQHHASVSLDRYKRYIVVDNAALVDQSKLAYVVLDDNKMPGMATGFCMVRNGEPALFVEGITVWNNWLTPVQQGQTIEEAAK